MPNSSMQAAVQAGARAEHHSMQELLIAHINTAPALAGSQG